MKSSLIGLSATLILACSASLALAQQELPAVTVHGQADYTGVWRPDQQVNAQLEREMRKKMRAKMKEAHGDRPPSSPSDGPGSSPRGGHGSGEPGSGGRGRGGRGGGGPPKNAAEPSMLGAMREEMDFASPLQGDLEIRSSETEILIGRAGIPLTKLVIGRGAVELPGGHTRAFAAWEKQQVVVEINSDDGVSVAHTYSLEKNGELLRVRTNVTGPMIRIPGGIDMERVFVRQP